MISPGSGGSPWVYRALAHYLAHHHYIVGLPEHPFNNRTNTTWPGTLQNLTARPRHLQFAIDALSDSGKFTAFLKPDQVVLIGHSMGGYTALASGVPTSFPHESPTGQALQIPGMVDRRIRALLLLAPAAVWLLAEHALRTVTVGVPILLLTAGRDAYTPYEHAQIILNGIGPKAQIEHRMMTNAGHFSFLISFPDFMVSPAFASSPDPPGFDRAQSQAELNAEILAFPDRES